MLGSYGRGFFVATAELLHNARWNSNGVSVSFALRGIARAVVFNAGLTLVFGSQLSGQNPATSPAQPNNAVVIAGRVLDPSGAPISNARVTVAAAKAHQNATALTDSLGRFSLSMQTGADQFFLTVDAPRMMRAQVSAISQDGSSVGVPDIQLMFSPSTLKPVRVRGQMIRPEPQSTTSAGSTEEFVPAERADQLVVDPSVLEALALVVPGAVMLLGQDGLPNYSVAGASPSQNSVTVDGSTSSSGSIPRDAIAGAVVSTTTSDVARARFSGGQVAAWTAHGSSSPRNTLHIWGTNPLLQGQSGRVPSSTEYSDIHVSGTSSGQLGTKPVFYFSALQLGSRNQTLGSFLGARLDRLDGLGFAPDSVARLFSIANKLVVPVAFAQPRQRSSTNGSAFLDLTVRRSNSSTLDFRVNGNLGSQRPVANGLINSGTSDVNAQSRSADLRVDWTATISDKVLNTFQTTASSASQRSTALTTVPAAAVVVGSGDGTTPLPLVIGGPGVGSRHESRTSWETTNESAVQTDNSRHRMKFGEFLRLERLSYATPDNNAGMFTFSSLADFETGSPASFTRTIGESHHRTDAYSGALFAGDRWKVAGARVEWQYGVRLEADWFQTRSDYNARVDSLFSLRTDRTPSELHVSPRLGLTWRYGHGEGGRPRGDFRVGVGEYRGVIPTGTVDAVASTNSGNLRQLTCLGSAVPAPTWQAFEAGAAVPTQCADGSPPALIEGGRDVSGFERTYGAPRSWRITSSVSGSMGEGVVLGIDGLYSRGSSQASVVDLNLRPAPSFLLSSEGGRPVYVAPQDVFAGGGLVASSASRIDSRYAGVWRYQSDLRSDARQITVRATLPPGFTIPGYWRLAYTFSNVREEARGYNGDTGGDPRQREFTRSGLERRHQVLLIGALPANRWFATFATVRLASGIPYTPMVASDINGDGSANDRAFVFAPDAGDTLVGSGMRRLLQSGIDARAKDCLTSQLGRIAERNSCTGPWTAAFDIHAAIRPGRLGFSDRLAATIRILNVFAGLDELLHGPSRMKGWGEPAPPDRILLTPLGFDSASQRFRYGVNPHFSRTDGALIGFANPFQINLDVRVLIGPDPRKNQLLEALGRGPGEHGPAPSVEELKARFNQQIPDPFRILLDLTDSLGLTAEQVSRLTTMQAAYTKDTDGLWEGVLTDLIDKVPGLNVRPAVRQLNETVMEVQRRQIRWGHALRTILSPPQRDAAPLYVQHIMFDDETSVEPLIR